jgi:membrane-associated phospholipid phosphatase
MVVATLTRPYRVTAPMVVLVAIVPLYLLIPDLALTREPAAPAVALDHVVPVVPPWSLVYGALYAFLIVLPVLVVRDDEHIRRTVWAYLSVWLAAYAVFLVYPTVAPRPAAVPGDGFGAWGLRSLYAADPPYNCFPSLHVAHSFVSALTCRQLHRGVGRSALAAAALVGLSTLFTKQHYVLDVVAGTLLAGGAWAVFLRGWSPAGATGLDREAAPVVAAALLAVVAAGVLAAWLVWGLAGPA